MLEPVDIPLLHEEPRFLAVAKPPGITVIPGRDEPPEASLRLRLEALRGERLWVVHRIDRDTSGVVVFARDAGTHRLLSQAFEHRQVAKEYLAWTRGMPAETVITVPLHAARKGRMRPASPDEAGALPSETRVTVEARVTTLAGELCRVRARPTTGRQHQLRVHLRAVGAPLLVDALYGRSPSLAPDALGPGAPAVPRLTLHAAKLTLPLKPPVTLEAPVPDDLAALDRWLFR